MTRRITDAMIERYCAERGYAFKPWEYPPPWAIADDEVCPWSDGAGAMWWPKAKRLRAKIVAELKREAAGQ
ncbi:MAG: hypothetical protein GEU95_00840 [Rhizobiales bacterium]|nr:hypothetical protein [Hyphomicrobiales bacterium]